ncbi:hypothetical protein [Lacibacter sp. H407]|uniref:hypothetical protein n=1 Tax=Lacibacter sp. H407 TaxID=3133423 RepID=UPI0030BF19FF
MKKQFILLVASVLICLLTATSVMLNNTRICDLDKKEMKQLPANDLLLHGPFNYFQL